MSAVKGKIREYKGVVLQTREISDASKVKGGVVQLNEEGFEVPSSVHSAIVDEARGS